MLCECCRKEHASKHRQNRQTVHSVVAGGAPEPDAEKEALREEVARLRGERGRVKGLKAQLERSVAALADQRAAFLRQQVRAVRFRSQVAAVGCDGTVTRLHHMQVVLLLQSPRQPGSQPAVVQSASRLLIHLAVH